MKLFGNCAERYYQFHSCALNEFIDQIDKFVKRIALVASATQKTCTEGHAGIFYGIRVHLEKYIHSITIYNQTVSKQIINT